MPELPVVSGVSFVKAMGLLGYEHVRTTGSHMILRVRGRQQLSVPDHRELRPGTLRGLIRDAGLSVEEFVELLERS